MGVVYHANYLVWCEVGRTDFIRSVGITYREMEEAGVRLAVSDVTMRFHAAARYDDVVRVATRLNDVRSRGVAFDYVITDAAGGARLVTATTRLIAIDPGGRPVAIPPEIRALLEAARDAPG